MSSGEPGVLVVADTPDPMAEAGQALIEVAFANITFVDTQFRASGFGPFKAKLPMIPGNGIGGVVIAVGSQADSGLVGNQVVSSTGGSGGYAERVVVDVGSLFEVPDGLALDHAVALLADGRTASALIRAVELHRGERVLVEAAAGGVGTLLVQLAKSAGTSVVAVVGGARKVEMIRDLGADVVVDYWSQIGWSRCAQPSAPTSFLTELVAPSVDQPSRYSTVAGECSASGWRVVNGLIFRKRPQQVVG